MSLTHAAAKADLAHPWDDVHILRHYVLRSGHDLADTSRFVDEAWDLPRASIRPMSAG
ncbi:hypothetical protein AB0C27_42125 [Nonomuraea sp. NPDC048882]|uniref:hypothetical protein n=1 Tax=Nonomuraea sp. NPDC048882 TaxID=3154347 RepID=UPI000A89CB04